MRQTVTLWIHGHGEMAKFIFSLSNFMNDNKGLA